MSADLFSTELRNKFPVKLFERFARQARRTLVNEGMNGGERYESWSRSAEDVLDLLSNFIHEFRLLHVFGSVQLSS